MNVTPLQPLEWQRFSLSQSALIEASAGTGKTHTLVLLVLRALLEQQLRLSDILLCTFTIAATAELSARVRERIHQLASWHALFLADSAQPELAPGDVELWLYLAQRWTDDAIKQSDAVRIHLAKADVVSFNAKTLHGFCAEVLQRFPIECQALAAQNSVDEASLLERALSLELQALSARANSADAPSWQRTFELNSGLLKKLISSLRRAYNYSVLDVVEMPIQPAPCPVPELHQPAVRAALCKSIADALATPGYALRDATKRVLIALQSWLQALPENADTSAANWHAAYKSCVGNDLKTVVKEGSQTTRKKLELPLAMANCFSLFSWHAHLIVAYESALFSHLLSAVRARMQAVILASQLMTFEQVIEQVKRAVVLGNFATKQERERTDSLLSALRAVYPLAFVDEFQDTNASQFAVLDAIYTPPQLGKSAGNKSATLIVIGDPKQAIYRFRGGDVYNYLRTADRLPRYVLSTNYRAQASLIDALNAFYSPIDSTAFATEGIAFHTIEKPINASAGEPAAMTFAILETRLPGKASVDRDIWGAHCINACALQIQNLLARGVEASDIAVLLPRGLDIDAQFATLQSLGIKAQLSARTEVGTGACAAALMRLLRCIDAPADRKRQRAIWLDLPFNLHADTLFGEAEHALARWFTPLPALLSQQGILAVTHALLQACGNLSPTEQARWQIDLRHVGELLSQSCASQNDCAALMASLEALLSQAATASNPEPNSSKQRGAAETAVSLMTLHGAKGLEFPHVLLPLLWSAKRRENTDYPLCTSATGMQIDLGSAKFMQARAQEKDEELAELLRLQYVAITRAAQSVWIAIAAPSMCTPEQNALHYSLNLLGHINPAAIKGDAPSWQAGVDFLLESAAISQQNIDADALADTLHTAVALARTQHAATPKPDEFAPDISALLYPLRKVQRRLSYSAITKMGAAARFDLPSNFEPPNVLAEIEQNAVSQCPDAELLELAPIRGRSFGLIAHTLFENLWPFDSARWFARLNTAIQALSRSDPEMAQLMNEPLRLAALRAMFERTAAAPLLPAAGSCNLASLDSAHRVIELEFHLPMPQLKLAQLAGLGPKHGLPALIELATPEPLSGMLQGFIDLVFFDQGRYYVLDYKTNALGECLSDYQADAIAAAMDKHHYHLQHLLYQLALHRYLSANLPGYRFDVQFGGAIYLFLRGFARGPGLGYFHHRASAELIAELSEILGA